MTKSKISLPWVNMIKQRRIVVRSLFTERELKAIDYFIKPILNHGKAEEQRLTKYLR